MKRLLKCILMLMFVASLVSCQSDNKESVLINPFKTEDQSMLKEKSQNSKNDILVVYFSAKDSISEDANIIKDYLFADLMEIVPVESYKDEDFDFTNPDSRILKELNDDTIKPEMSNSLTDIKKYKWIFLGFPVWQGKMPKIINTFLEKYDFEDKYIFTFCKADTDNLDNIRDDINEAVKKGNPYIYPPKNIPDGEFVDNITAWIDWCNPTTEYDEGLLPTEGTTTETTEPDLSEGLSIVR